MLPGQLRHDTGQGASTVTHTRTRTPVLRYQDQTSVPVQRSPYGCWLPRPPLGHVQLSLLVLSDVCILPPNRAPPSTTTATTTTEAHDRRLFQVKLGLFNLSTSANRCRSSLVGYNFFPFFWGGFSSSSFSLMTLTTYPFFR